MTEALRYVNVAVDAAQDYQTIDGFGVNINSKYWGAPAFDTAQVIRRKTCTTRTGLK